MGQGALDAAGLHVEGLMMCIVGWVDQDRTVWIGGDSAGVGAPFCILSLEPPA